MTKQLMIYGQAAPVSSSHHRDWSVAIKTNYNFAATINSVPVLAPEFMPAALEYAIVFAGDENAVFPSAVLGIRTGSNAYVAEDGNWDGNYVPAFLRRYPFVFSRVNESDQLTLCIDEEFEGFNQDGRGERLFDSEGNRTQYLENILKFTQEYQIQFNQTTKFAEKIKELDLLEPAQVKIQSPDGGEAGLAGFYTVSRAKLQNLAGDKLAELAQSGALELCYAQLISLNNLNGLAKRYTQTADA